MSKRCGRNDKQCRPWSDCSSSRSSLIWIYSVCPALSVRKLRIITVQWLTDWLIDWLILMLMLKFDRQFTVLTQRCRPVGSGVQGCEPETECTRLILAPIYEFSYDSHPLRKQNLNSHPLFQTSLYGPALPDQSEYTRRIISQFEQYHWRATREV